MASEWDVLIVLNYYEEASLWYFNVHSEIGKSVDASPKIIDIQIISRGG